MEKIIRYIFSKWDKFERKWIAKTTKELIWQWKINKVKGLTLSLIKYPQDFFVQFEIGLHKQ